MAATTSQIALGISSSTGPEQDEFWGIVEAYRGELVNQALAALGNLSDAEDCAQETFCEAFRHPQRTTEATSLRALLRSINRANALDALRRRANDTRHQDRRRQQGQRAVTTGGFSLLELRETLARHVEDLPDTQRTVLVLRFWEHLSYEQIGKRMKLPTTTVWEHYFEASLALGRLLGPDFDLQPLHGKEQP